MCDARQLPPDRLVLSITFMVVQCELLDIRQHNIVLVHSAVVAVQIAKCSNHSKGQRAVVKLWMAMCKIHHARSSTMPTCEKQSAAVQLQKARSQQHKKPKNWNRRVRNVPGPTRSAKVPVLFVPIFISSDIPSLPLS